MFKYIILFAAIFLASCAAIFSISGISQLFVGAMIFAGIMASAIELGKIVTVSVLYRFWGKLPRSLKYYLFGAVIISSICTSAGIYGYLSSAYAAGASDIQSKQNQISLYESEKRLVQKRLSQDSSRLEHLQGIQNQQENRLDSLLAKDRNTNTQQTILRENNKEMSNIQKEMTSLTQKLDSLEMTQTQTTNSITSSGKIGTFYYVAKTLNVSLDTIVKWFILILVAVFDPLSISLFLAYNVAVKYDKNDDDEIDPDPVKIPETTEYPIPAEEDIPKPPSPPLESPNDNMYSSKWFNK